MNEHSMSEHLISVLIVDDHPVFRHGLSMVVNNQIDMRVIGEASNGQEAVQKAASLQPDVIIMDMMMPTMNGIEAIGYIARATPNIHILAFSGSEDDETILAAIEAGATGYLPKDSSPVEISQAIRDAHAGIPSLPPGVALTLMKGLRKAKAEKSLEG